MRHLLATTAIMTMAFAGAAQAAGLTVGGYMHVGTAFGRDVPGDGDSIHVIRDGEIHFTGEHQLNTGAKAGVKVELEAWSQGGDYIDKNFAYLEGGFGRLTFGGTDPAKVSTGYAGVGFVNGAVNYYDATFGFVPGWGSVYPEGYNDSIGLHYQSPSIAGLTVGLSYLPDADADGANDRQHTGGLNSDTLFSVGANYSREFGAASVYLGAGYVRDRQNNLNLWHVGVDIGFNGFNLHLITDQGTRFGVDEKQYGIGLDYALNDKLTIGGGYAWNDADVKHATFGATYKLTDGANVSGILEYGDDGVNDGFAAVMLLGLTF